MYWHRLWWLVAIAGAAVLLREVSKPYLDPPATVAQQQAEDKVIPPPGWDCEYVSPQCGPAQGFHLEDDRIYGGHIAILDNVDPHGPLWVIRDYLIDTSRAWGDLTNQERERIHRGEATIYSYFQFRFDDDCREKTGADALTCNDQWGRRTDKKAGQKYRE